MFALTPQQVEEMAMVDIAYMLLFEAKEPISFRGIVDQISELKKLSPEQMEQLMPQLYTEINIDGRFAHVGDSQWGLKKWYPIEQFDDITTSNAPRKKKAKVVEDDFDDLEDFDIIDDEDFDEDFEEEDEDFDEVEDEVEDFEDEDAELEEELEEDVDFIEDETIIEEDESLEELAEEEIEEEDEDL